MGKKIPRLFPPLVLICALLAFLLPGCSDPDPLDQTQIDAWAAAGKTLTIPAGRYRVRRSLVFPQGSVTRVAPGAVFRMDAGTSLFFEGRLDVAGASERAVVFYSARSWAHLIFDLVTEPIEAVVHGWVSRASETQGTEEAVKGALKQRFGFTRERWGGLVLKGAGAEGSTIRHAVIQHAWMPFYDERDGVPGADFPGAVSLYRTSARIENTVFRSNFSDSISAVESDVVVKDCRFERNNNDAIDLGRSQGVIESNVILNTNADGIDLSESKALVVGNRISRSRATGIEVGQRSTATIEKNEIAFSGSGAVDLSDESSAIVRSNRFKSNPYGIRLHTLAPDVYAWGGRVTACEHNLFETNGRDIVKENGSEIDCR